MLASKFDNLCPQFAVAKRRKTGLNVELTTYARSFAEGTTSPKCQTMECLHSNWMTYGRSLLKDKHEAEKLCA